MPILAWPVRGDQIYNAKLMVNYLKMGHMALATYSYKIDKEELLDGMTKIMSNKEIHSNAAVICSKFCSGFPTTSVAAFADFIGGKQE